ncbi:protein binding protein, putative [Ricinus communis]|uniref:Protein binding protein, putative n=1 Tax=Ricinus communis TaxID=3988 RepID=B9SNH5_RICCO|nr:protein binding protein, putative [Ricinus communis]|eukprot:XP_002527544.1 protein OBERON 3 isoform X1 [Ricinus communis]
MVGEKDHHGGEAESPQNKEHPEVKIGSSQKGLHFFRESKMGFDGFASKPQELTLSYLCENPKLGFTSTEKGKEVIFSSENSNQDDEKWVERDFMNLSETKSFSSSKREIHEEEEEEEEEIERENCPREKKPKLESALNLSLALPDVSLSLTASNALQTADPVIKPKPSRSMQSLGAAPSNNNTQTTCSNDFTAASLSYSYSHPFSHNPSCSLTRNSTENYEYSVGRDDQIWCGGEGTNGSVHSRFRPIGDGLVALNNNNNHVGGSANGGFSMMQSHRVTNKDSCNNSLYRTTSSENLSFFPSELPARPRLDAYSGDSRRRDSENLRGLEGVDAGGKARKLSRPERILREIVSESIPVIAQIIQELTEETLESTKEYLRNLIVMPEKRDELAGLQNRLGRRSDLTKETLLKCQKDQLEILVAVKMGLVSFISEKVRLPASELVETFLYLRCRNVNCNSILPVEDCECKFCSTNKGFCSSCMCPVCMNFDCANNTCSWVGCDVCSHWCHAACGIQKNLIRPGPSLKGPKGTTEMQFHCIGCNHASEMFGFVKDVFVFCAKDWGLETLIKELDCVRKIFKGSEDIKGKELHVKAEELLSRLDSKTISISDSCNIIFQFFNNADDIADLPASGVSAKELMPTEPSLRKDVATIPPATSLPPKYAIYNTSSSGGKRDSLSNDLHRNDLKAAFLSDLKIEDEFQFGKLSKKDGLDSLESIVRIKEAEARMFQSKADDARREAEGYRRMIRAKSEKLEEEYAEKLAKLCLQETEERRRKKLEELKVLEHSHGDYYNMKLRMQAEIAGLLERMETTKQQWV